MDLHGVMIYYNHHHHPSQHHEACNGVTLKVAYTVGERVFAMDLSTWTTEDLGPVILMSEESHDDTNDANNDHCNDNVVIISIIIGRATQ